MFCSPVQYGRQICTIIPTDQRPVLHVNLLNRRYENTIKLLISAIFLNQSRSNDIVISANKTSHSYN